MATTTHAVPGKADALLRPQPRLWSVGEYHRAAELGLFGPDEKLELINGEVVHKVGPQGAGHYTAYRRTIKALETAFGPRFDVRPAGPLTASDVSEPEPDVLVAIGPLERYARNHPVPADVLLVVEVSDSTLAVDRGVKAALYAAAGIREYWIVNLPDQRIEVYSEPDADPTVVGGAIYKTRAIRKSGDTITPLGAPDAAIPVADLLPPLDAP